MPLSSFTFDPHDSFSGFSAPPAAADGCTQCGICLSVCPTYQQSQAMDQSPMGRIRLMRALDSGNSEGLALEQLDSCLGCYACEAICPSQVQYGHLLDQALVRLRERRPLGALPRLMLAMAVQPMLLKMLTRLTALSQGFGIRRLFRALGLFRLLGLSRTDRLLGTVRFPGAGLENRVRQDQPARRVALFTGCYGSVLEQHVQQAGIDVLNALGIEVSIPKGQGCCGALHRHNGDSERACALARNNIRAFDPQQVDAIITTSSGCGAGLKAYPQWFEDTADAACDEFSGHVMDISQYLAQRLQSRKVIFRPLHLKIAIHLPCTLKQVAGQAAGLNDLLALIPGLELHPLSANPACCGSGGSQVLTQADMADTLRDKIIAEVAELKPDILLSSNLGCALHLQAGLHLAGLDIPLLHPVQLLEQALAVEFVSVRAASSPSD